MNTIKILAIDDKMDNLITIKALLNNLEPNYEVLTAENGEKGIEMAASKLPDTILLDIQMPDMDGLEVCRRLRQEKKTAHIPIIFLTAVKTNPKDRIKGLAAGGDLYLTKPIDEAELLASLNAMIRIKKAEDELLRQYKIIISSSTDMMAFLDIDFTYLAVNQAYCDAFNKSSDDIVGYKIEEIFGKDFFDSVIKPNVINCLKGDKINYITWMDFPAFGKRYMEINYYPYIGETGCVEGIVVNGRDVTERKQIEEELQRSEEKFRSFIEDSHDAIFASSIDGSLIYFNQAMAKLLGYSWDELFELNFTDLYTNPDDRFYFQEKIDSQENIESFEVQIQKNDNTVLDCIVSASLQMDSNNETLGYQGIIHDITELRKTDRLNKVLFEITRASISTNALPDLIKSFRTILHRVIDTTNFYVALIDRPTGMITTPYAHDMYDQIASYPIGNSLTGYVIKTEKTLFANAKTIADLHNEGKIKVEGTMPQLWLGVPLMEKKQAIGAIVVQSYDNNKSFTKDDAKILEYVSKEIAHGIRQKRADEQVRSSQQYYRNLVNSSMDMIIAVDTKRRITEFNRAAEETFGYVKEEVIGQPATILYAEPKENIHIHNATIKNGHHIQEIYNKRKNGEIFPVKLAASVLVDLDGNEIGVMGVSRDITQAHNSRELLMLSEERHRAVVESANDAIISINSSGDVIAWNLSAQVMFGYFIDEVNETSLQRIIPERFRKDHIRGLDRVTAGGGSNVIGQTVELVGLHKDGTEFPIEFSLTSWESAGEMFFTAIIRDITIKKQDQINLENALEEAKQGTKIKSLFLANISHEIRTPLNSIIGYSDLLREELEDHVGTDEKEFFDVIDRSGKRLIRTVHEILDMSQMDTQSYNLNITEFDLCDIVQQAIIELTPNMKEKKLTAEFYSEIEDPMLAADEYCITQAISNLIDNAIKYTETGGLTIWIDGDKESIILVIKDTGIGISKAFQKQLFEIFSQESAGYSRKYEGLGLGLALTKRYLEVNNATINIDSIKGAGTKVTLTFQRKEVS